MSNRTPLQRLGSAALGRDVLDWATERRDNGATFKQIADDLSAVVGFTVNRETIRLWLAEAVKS
jgi:hypothetical protein